LSDDEFRDAYFDALENCALNMEIKKKNLYDLKSVTQIMLNIKKE
jgi:hypothetical protein